MQPEKIIQTLGELHHLISPANKPWYVIGTTGLMLSGFEIEPHDIDILTDAQTADKIKVLLQAFEMPIQLKDEGKFRSAFSRYVINGASVEVMGDLQVKTSGNWIDILPIITHPVYVEVNGLLFAVPSKKEQIKIYTLFGRSKDNAALSLLNAI